MVSRLCQAGVTTLGACIGAAVSVWALERRSPVIRVNFCIHIDKENLLNFHFAT